MDEEAFRNTFLEWRNGVWLPERKRIAARVCEDAENRDRLFQLQVRLEENSILPFVGAGLSIPSGFRPWKAFLHQLRVHCYPPLLEEEFAAILSGPDGYELAAGTCQYQ